jgi:hypothetical protein
MGSTGAQARGLRARKFRVRRIALALLCFGLGSCVSVPLSTMVRMSTFDERDFAALDPEVLRVRITLPQGFGLDVKRSWLGVELTSAAGTHQATFELDPERIQTAEIAGGFFADTRSGTAYVLRLSAPSKAKFRDLQSFVAKGRSDQITIRVVPRLSSSPKDADGVTVWIDLRLSQADGYFTLVDAATIELDALRE